MARPPLRTAVPLTIGQLAARLGRMESLLLEMRFAQDVQLKALTKVQRQVDALAERKKRR